MEKLSEAEQQRSEARLRIKTKSNYIARGGNPKKFDQFWTQENIYGISTLDQSDIIKLKEFATPDEAISHTERAFRANMISPEVKEQANALINKNRKNWDKWRKEIVSPKITPKEIPEPSKTTPITPIISPKISELPISSPGTVIKPLYPGLGYGGTKKETYSFSTMEENINKMSSDKKKKFEERVKFLQKKYPKRTERQIQEFVLIEMGYEEQ